MRETAARLAMLVAEATMTAPPNFDTDSRLSDAERQSLWETRCKRRADEAVASLVRHSRLTSGGLRIDGIQIT